MMDSMSAFATSLATSAADVLSAGYTGLVRQLRGNDASGIEYKQNREVVTAAEKVAEQLMRDRVRAAFPQHTIIGEELGTSSGNEWTWVFDPIDGTSAMVRTAMAEAAGQVPVQPAPAFGITVAVLHGDEAMIGVVAELRAQDGGLAVANIWVGRQDFPTTCNDKEVVSSTPHSLSSATLTCTVPDVMFSTFETWGSFQALAEGTATFVPDQNCVGFMRLLGGGIDIAYEADLGLPDAAALIPPLTGAGIRVTDHKGHRPRFDATSRSGEYRLLAASPGLHAQALEITLAGVDPARNTFPQRGTEYNLYAKKFDSGAP